jgi:hypothetical protein
MQDRNIGDVLMPGPFSIETQVAIDRAVAEERERCAKIADDYAAPNRFAVSDGWKTYTPAEVYDTAAIDVGTWIAGAIRECSDKNGIR